MYGIGYVAIIRTKMVGSKKVSPGGSGWERSEKYRQKANSNH